MSMIQGQLKQSDYVAAQYLNIKPRLGFAIIGVLLLACVLIVMVLSRSLVLAICVAYLVLMYAVFIPFGAKRSFRLYKALSEHTVVEVRADGLFFKRANGEGLVPWNEIVKWKKNNSLVLLYPTNNVFYLVPAHFFESPGDFTSFCGLVESRTKK
jgi:hypothetical protein